MIVATDADGDEVPGAASGSFTVAVQDDIPVQVTPPTPVAATVEEDGMDAAVVARRVSTASICRPATRKSGTPMPMTKRRVVWARCLACSRSGRTSR